MPSSASEAGSGTVSCTSSANRIDGRSAFWSLLVWPHGGEVTNFVEACGIRQTEHNDNGRGEIPGTGQHAVVVGFPETVDWFAEPGASGKLNSGKIRPITCLVTLKKALKKGLSSFLNGDKREKVPGSIYACSFGSVGLGLSDCPKNRERREKINLAPFLFPARVRGGPSAKHVRATGWRKPGSRSAVSGCAVGGLPLH